MICPIFLYCQQFALFLIPSIPFCPLNFFIETNFPKLKKVLRIWNFRAINLKKSILLYFFAQFFAKKGEFSENYKFFQRKFSKKHIKFCSNIPFVSGYVFFTGKLPSGNSQKEILLQFFTARDCNYNWKENLFRI